MPINPQDLQQAMSSIDNLCRQMQTSEAQNAQLLQQLSQREQMATQQLSQLRNMVAQLSQQVQ